MALNLIIIWLPLYTIQNDSMTTIVCTISNVNELNEVNSEKNSELYSWSHLFIKYSYCNDVGLKYFEILKISEGRVKTLHCETNYFAIFRFGFRGKEEKYYISLFTTFNKSRLQNQNNSILIRKGLQIFSILPGVVEIFLPFDMNPWPYIVRNAVLSHIWLAELLSGRTVIFTQCKRKAFSFYSGMIYTLAG